MPWPLTRDYVKAMMNEFKERRTISRKHVIQMLLAMKDVLTKEPSLVDVSVPEEKPDTEEESDLSERIEEVRKDAAVNIISPLSTKFLLTILYQYQIYFSYVEQTLF